MNRLLTFAFAASAALSLVGLSPDAFAQLKGKSYRDCKDCPELVSIPAGSFTMGVPPEEEERENTAKAYRTRGVPQHHVTVPAFAMGKYPVTRGEFAVFVKATGRDMGDTCSIWTIENGRPKFETKSGNSWSKANFPQTDRDPVFCVSWDDAKAYVAWLSKKAGHAYRLPTEAEWEYAARAGTTGARYWGDKMEDACKYENGADLTFAAETKTDKADVFPCTDGYTYTSPVGKFKPNAFGLYDMLGNMVQWVEDCAASHNYEGAPTDGSAWLAGDCTMRGVRGTGPRMAVRYLRVGLRDWVKTDYRGTMYGFRVARTQ